MGLSPLLYVLVLINLVLILVKEQLIFSSNAFRCRQRLLDTLESVLDQSAYLSIERYKPTNPFNKIEIFKFDSEFQAWRA